jgi:hypothetical protein
MCNVNNDITGYKFIYVLTTLQVFPSYAHVCVYNLTMMLLALIFAIFYDRVGDIFRYGFAFCGFALVYLFPVSVEQCSKLKSFAFP